MVWAGMGWALQSLVRAWFVQGVPAQLWAPGAHGMLSPRPLLPLPLPGAVPEALGWDLLTGV